MIRIKIGIYFLLSKLVKYSSRNKITLFIFFLAISTFANTIAMIMFKGSSAMTAGIFFSLIFAVTMIRPSNCLMYTPITKHLSMSVFDLSNYHALDYYKDRVDINKLFRGEFIEGIINLSTLPFCSKIKMTTHEWVVENVVKDSKVLALYDIKIKPYNYCKIPLEVLILNPNNFIFQNKEKLSNNIFRKRKQYKVILVRKNKKHAK